MTYKPYDLSVVEHDYAPWEGAPERTIVICTHPRSGSTLLGEALYFAQDLGCPLEYFHRGFRPGLERQWGVSGIAEFARAVHEKRTGPNGTLAIKLFWRDIEDLLHEMQPDEFGASGSPAPSTYLLIQELIAPLMPNPIFVYLKRCDEVRQAVSSVTAAQSGRWRLIPGVEEKAALQEPAYSSDRIAGQIGFSRYCHDHWIRFFEAARITPFRLTYEEIDRDYRGSMGSLFSFLGSNSEVPEMRMRRQSNADTEAFVLRFLQENQHLAAAAGGANS